MEKIKRGTNWMQHAFNFTLEKMICLKKQNNSIKIGIFCLYFETKKMWFFCLYFKTERIYINFWLKYSVGPLTWF